MIKNINAIVSCLKHWSHYLVANSFYILTMKHLHISKVNKSFSMHAKWVEYLQSFFFTIKHKFREIYIAFQKFPKEDFLI